MQKINSKNPLERLRSVFRIKKNPVKLTALLYLQEALLLERYEECADFIQVAQEFGAQDAEIRNLLENPKRIIKS